MEAIELLEPTGLSASAAEKGDLRFVRSTDLVSRDIAGETVVVPICRGVGDLDSIFTFNAVGTHVWNLLTEGRSEAELTSSVTKRFQVSEYVAQSDVRNFLTDLLGVGLVRTA
jgi:Coenzyme PQQ synthesis protein D (PqqD)